VVRRKNIFYDINIILYSIISFCIIVAAGFPSGQYPLQSRLEEVRCAIDYGAQEIDIVIDRSLVLDKKWEQLYDELVAIRKACDEKKKICLKTILSTGELDNLTNVYKTAMIAMMAGADFIKTSTGKETVNATLPVGIIMCQAIMKFQKLTNRKVL
jgi:deoxyribose-phosphate aldolase